MIIKFASTRQPLPVKPFALSLSKCSVRRLRQAQPERLAFTCKTPQPCLSASPSKGSPCGQPSCPQAP